MTPIRDLRVFHWGDSFKGPEPRFFVGAAAVPFADPLEFRHYRLAKKVKAGANFIQTQLIYDRWSSLGKLEVLRALQPPKNWRTSRDGGPRKIVREDLRLTIEED